MARTLICVAIAVSTLLVGQVARAACTSTWIGTAPGTAIPPVGSLYVYDDALDDTTVAPQWQVTGDGQVRSTVTRIGDRVARIDYRTDGRWLEVRATHRAADAAEARYVVDGAWAAPDNLPRVARYIHEASPSGDDNAVDLLSIQIPQPTAAIRVRWRRGAVELERIVPARPRMLVDWHAPVLQLGKLDCSGATIDPAELYAGGALVLTAIRFDGTEVPVTGVPDWIHLGTDADTMHVVVARQDPVTVAAGATAAAADDDSYPWPRWIGLVIAAIALGLRRVTRRPRDLSVV